MSETIWKQRNNSKHFECRDEARSFLRWVAYEFSTCLATEEETEKLSEAMRTLELSVYDQETRRFT
jgi:hypothetical protein